MRMWIQIEGGLKTDALLLAVSRDQMRLVLAGQRDTIGLTMLDGYWKTESGQAVEIDAIVPVAGTDCSQFCAELYPQTMSAGRSFTA